jgi:hypothetical protein
MTPSARARKVAAKHPDWSLAKIGEACGLTRQGVAKALAATKPRGRPKGIAGKRKSAKRP